ncbi:ATP-binding protein [Dactylosporangium matsuzakiense]|uniref:ATP-binding protein n=1 Tax=Dactylosporangium matsuzakiense TaxID=53360 RepID=UPI0021C29AE1|nr:ATP-binding protein [Dactylosporangium matsuzakiense]UWZ41848.1 ATP-binding protein [Dactylosporangium matsuzakiense]
MDATKEEDVPQHDMRLQFSLELPRDAALVRDARRTLDGALAGAGVTEECRDDIRLALTEACGNVVSHANLASGYHIDVTVDDGECVIEVTDDGGGFNPARVPPVEPVEAGHEPGHLKESGRGLQVLAAVVERLDVVSVEDTGTLVRFSKHLTWDPAPQQEP